jgi:hypothetical protein
VGCSGMLERGSDMLEKAERVIELNCTSAALARNACLACSAHLAQRTGMREGTSSVALNKLHLDSFARYRRWGSRWQLASGCFRSVLAWARQRACDALPVRVPLPHEQLSRLLRACVRVVGCATHLCARAAGLRNAAWAV